MPNSIPKKSWTHISADFITKLPLAQGYCYEHRVGLQLLSALV